MISSLHNNFSVDTCNNYIFYIYIDGFDMDLALIQKLYRQKRIKICQSNCMYSNLSIRIKVISVRFHLVWYAIKIQN